MKINIDASSLDYATEISHNGPPCEEEITVTSMGYFLIKWKDYDLQCLITNGFPDKRFKITNRTVSKLGITTITFETNNFEEAITKILSIYKSSS